MLNVERGFCLEKPNRSAVPTKKGEQDLKKIRHGRRIIRRIICRKFRLRRSIKLFVVFKMLISIYSVGISKFEDKCLILQLRLSLSILEDGNRAKKMQTV